MGIKGAKTVEEFKKMQKIEQWINKNFVKGSVTWKLVNDAEFEVTDKTGDTMTMAISDIIK